VHVTGAGTAGTAGTAGAAGATAGTAVDAASGVADVAAGAGEDGPTGGAGDTPADGAATGAGIGATPSFRGVPHFAQAIQDGSSIDALHFGQRPPTKGSIRPQDGQRAASREMYVPQAGHGCLNVGIVAPQLAAAGSARLPFIRSGLRDHRPTPP
jgi:hypothetical protein